MFFFASTLDDASPGNLGSAVSSVLFWPIPILGIPLISGVVLFYLLRLFLTAGPGLGTRMPSYPMLVVHAAIIAVAFVVLISLANLPSETSDRAAQQRDADENETIPVVADLVPLEPGGEGERLRTALRLTLYSRNRFPQDQDLATDATTYSTQLLSILNNYSPSNPKETAALENEKSFLTAVCEGSLANQYPSLDLYVEKPESERPASLSNQVFGVVLYGILGFYVLGLAYKHWSAYSGRKQDHAAAHDLNTLFKSYTHGRIGGDGIFIVGPITLCYPKIYVNDVPYDLRDAGVDPSDSSKIILKDGRTIELFSEGSPQNQPTSDPGPGKPRFAWDYQALRASLEPQKSDTTASSEPGRKSN